MKFYVKDDLKISYTETNLTEEEHIKQGFKIVEERTPDEIKQRLEETDYIANKLAEAVSKYISTGDNTDVLLLREKYALELANREEWRKEIDKLQQELKLLDK